MERGQLITGRLSLKEQTGISEQSIRTAFEKLKSTNEITIKSTNKYSIVTICNYNEYQDNKREINQQLTNNQPTTNHKQEYKECNNKNKDINTLGDFKIFWETYPKKKSKGQAEKVWQKLKPDEQLLAAMVAKIEQAKTSDEWQKDCGKFIPHPATWLNAKGWEDEIQQKETEGDRIENALKKAGMV